MEICYYFSLPRKNKFNYVKCTSSMESRIFFFHFTSLHTLYKTFISNNFITFFICSSNHCNFFRQKKNKTEKFMLTYCVMSPSNRINFQWLDILVALVCLQHAYLNYDVIIWNKSAREWIMALIINKTFDLLPHCLQSIHIQMLHVLPLLFFCRF